MPPRLDKPTLVHLAIALPEAIRARASDGRRRGTLANRFRQAKREAKGRGLAGEAADGYALELLQCELANEIAELLVARVGGGAEVAAAVAEVVEPARLAPAPE